ncbi:uncharacterized protein N0V89_003541 [Didymosphaeria variabile]|uniref:Uncharacterized protein n=1 Tax=Didymosphaeria variabile TaxID=1932322 RepID=A0A9W9CBL5_9PLEO|nr:uncharacterized protein N0V89_003541 [Didymosphaeria variabile]KAJ4355524.1 hypothetical protein N0V89_003541 [Didymosphaeria variabile]
MKAHTSAQCRFLILHNGQTGLRTTRDTLPPSSYSRKGKVTSAPKQQHQAQSLKTNAMIKIDVSQCDDSQSRSVLKKQLHNSIVRRERVLQGILKSLDESEDSYRLQGTLYHTTNLPARTSSHTSPDAQQRLRAAFLDFEVWNKPLLEIRELAIKVLWECRPNGTLEALLEREKAAAALCIPLREAIEALEGHSDDLYLLEAVNNNLTRFSWYLYDNEADKERGFRLPADKGPEWEAFREWVSTLPETRKSMSDKHDPRSLDVLASEMLYKHCPVLWDGHRNAPRPEVSAEPGNYDVFSMSDLEALMGCVNYGYGGGGGYSGPAAGVFNVYVAKVLNVGVVDSRRRAALVASYANAPEANGEPH